MEFNSEALTILKDHHISVEQYEKWVLARGSKRVDLIYKIFWWGIVGIVGIGLISGIVSDPNYIMAKFLVAAIGLGIVYGVLRLAKAVLVPKGKYSEGRATVFAFMSGIYYNPMRRYTYAHFLNRLDEKTWKEIRETK